MVEHAKVLWVHEAMVRVVVAIVTGTPRFVQRPVAVWAVRIGELDIGGAARVCAQRELARAVIVDDDCRAMAAGEGSATKASGSWVKLWGCLQDDFAAIQPRHQRHGPRRCAGSGAVRGASVGGGERAGVASGNGGGGLLAALKTA